MNVENLNNPSLEMSSLTWFNVKEGDTLTVTFNLENLKVLGVDGNAINRLIVGEFLKR